MLLARSRKTRGAGIKLYTSAVGPYADDVNLLEDKRHTVKKNTETLIDANKEAGCCLVTRMQGKVMT
jgi:hypothetical protein